MKEIDNWKIAFFSVLFVGIFFFSSAYHYTNSQTQTTEQPMENGKWVTYYTPLEDGTVVYYKGFVKEIGYSEFNLIQICDEQKQQCRNPTKEEVSQDRYLG